MKGFTMIELIFVIVILGVLAAIAIPRLAATRDDAEVVRAAQNVSTSLTVKNPITAKNKVCATYTVDSKNKVTLKKSTDGLCAHVWEMPGLKNINAVYSSDALLIIQ